jgi:hypothetical protein
MAGIQSSSSVIANTAQITAGIAFNADIEDARRVIRSRKSKKNRNTMTPKKRTNNVLPKTTQKTV